MSAPAITVARPGDIQWEAAFEEALAQIAAAAAGHDRDRTFPADELDALRRLGLVALTVPAAAGGAGAGLATAVRVLERVGAADPSVGLILMWQFVFQAELGRDEGRWPAAVRERFQRSAVEEGALVNALRVEPALGTPARGGTPATTARATSDGFSLHGHKIYCTGIPGLRWLLVWAATDEPEPRVGAFLVEAGTPGYRVEDTWDAIGLRASASHDVILEGVEVPADHAVDIRTPAAWQAQDRELALAWVTALFAANYIGIAVAARDWLAGYLHERVPSGLGRPLATLPRFEVAVGEIEAAIQVARTLIRDLAEGVDAGRPGAAAQGPLVKHVATENAIAAIDTALRLTGNPGISGRYPLERHHRDALTGRIHTPQADTVLGGLGRIALGTGGVCVSLGDTVEIAADVLVVGGGLAGAWSAAAAARAGARVVLVDKGWCGTSGITAQAGPGHWWVPPEPEARERAVARQTERARGLGDPAWMARALALTWDIVPGMAGYYAFPTDDRGEVPMRSLRGPEYLRGLRHLIGDLGVRIVDHAPANGLLVDGAGAAAGATGVLLRSGYAWRARAASVILATGGCAFRSHLLGAHNNTGDGLLMAAEAGAELSGMEFSAYYSVTPVRSNMARSVSYAFASYRDESGALLEGIPRVDNTLALSAALGRGRVWARWDQMPAEYRERLHLVQPALLLPFVRRGIDPFRDWFEITLRGEGTVRGVGGLRHVDDDAQTTVPGLFAAGDVSSREPLTGATSGGGAQNSTWAVASAQAAGAAAAARARRVGASARATAPGPQLTLAERDVPYADVVRRVQDEVLDLDRALVRTEAKLAASGARLDGLWGVVAEADGRGDARADVRQREAAAMVATARWCIAAAQARPESRGLHRRADHPAEEPAWTRRITVSGLDDIRTAVTASLASVSAA